MQPISPLVRLCLAAVAAAVATLLAPDVFHVLPLWLQIVAGAVSAALTVFVIPPNWAVTETRTAARRRLPR